MSISPLMRLLVIYSLEMPERVSAKSNGHSDPTCLTRPLVRGKAAGQQPNETGGVAEVTGQKAG